jgi:hypothetical protein
MINTMRLYYLLFIIFGLLFLSCQQQKEDEIQILKDEVIEIHDEVMPLMSDLTISRKRILSKIEELSENTEEGDSTLLKLKVLERNLEDAFQGMFIWMRQFNTQFENMKDEEIKAYLNEQKEMVTKVNVTIKNTLEEANKYLN